SFPCNGKDPGRTLLESRHHERFPHVYPFPHIAAFHNYSKKPQTIVRCNYTARFSQPGRHRKCKSASVSCSLNSVSLGRTASVLEVGGLRRPARNCLTHVAASVASSYTKPCSAAACNVQCGLYRCPRAMATRSARPANRIELASSYDEMAPTAITATPAGPATS